jgi:hypothetical protein
MQLQATRRRRAASLPASPGEWQGFDVDELGWMDPARYVPLARGAVPDKVAAPLRALGLVLAEAELEMLLQMDR